MDALIQRYLQDSLGLAIRVSAWSGDRVPYHLHDAFEFRQLGLSGHSVLLAIDRRADRTRLAEARDTLDRLRELAGQPVIYVTDALASYERRRLVGWKMPFLVPGNQLYLPDLGIDLREVFRRPAAEPPAALSPAAQAMLIAALWRAPPGAAWRPSEVVESAGYTAMTVSRAARELVAAGLANRRVAGKTHWLVFQRSPEDTWTHARPLLRSPVRRTVWVGSSPRTRLLSLREAGLSALARWSSLADPDLRTVAIGESQWRAVEGGGIDVLADASPEAWALQLWHYSPALAREDDVVDPLSLALSLDAGSDERVQMALDELERHFPWSVDSTSSGSGLPSTPTSSS